MKKAILGKKVGMTTWIIPDTGRALPVTVIQADPNLVVQKKDIEKEGYTAVQLGFSDLEARKMSKPKKGHFEKSGLAFKKHLKEFRIENADELNVGDLIKVDIFANGDKVDVCGTSKGKGFAGPIKRWGAHRGPMSHGSGYHRGPGSMGGCSDPSRVFKGKKLAGHLGAERVTIQNLEVVSIDTERNLILIHGAVPGPKGGIVSIINSVKIS